MASALCTFSAAGKSQIVKDLPTARSSVRPRVSHPSNLAVFKTLRKVILRFTGVSLERGFVL
jgi:hypothetical protein